MELRPGYKQTEVGAIPQRWVVTRLGDLLERVTGGGTPSRSNPHYWGGEIPWITVKDFATFSPHRAQESITRTGLRNSASNLIPRGTVITSTRMALGKAVIYDVDVSINQDLKALFPKPSVSTKYLYYWFEYKEQDIADLGSGSTVKGISLSDLRAIEFYLAPLDEQRAIATALSDVDALLAKLDALIAKKRDIKQAAMQQLLTGKQRLPGFSGEWEVKRLGEIGIFSKGKGLSKEELSPSGILPAIPYTAIYTDFNEVIDPLKIRRFTDLPRDAIVINSPHVLIASSSNMLDNVGKAAAFIGGYDVAVGGDIILYKTISNVSFLSYLLSTQPHRKRIVFLSQGSTIRHVYISTFANYDIGLPSLAEQTAIATVLSDMDAEIAALETQRDKTRALKQGMMQELLTGRIRLL